ncbi:glycosyltransferase family 25 protein [Bradyrhizobium sp. WSM3983]|uniref:glycosyltransferase family 25 protein n=1 Tax=Bradyrhizobium sp. WSM3983 TaxID=1038867 RepID=UPI0007C4B515|nr:glycosyltransferase family 25 protein [Bradyrhizobium sp. WSM3983]
MTSTIRKVVINLETRRDRRAEMTRQLARVGWQADFFPAVRPIDAGGFESIGARGCFMSHLGILQQARDDGISRLMIMEDDLSFSKRFPDLWNKAYEQLLEQESWSIFYPAHTLDLTGDGLTPIKSATPIRCTHFMLFSGTALGPICAELEAILARPPGSPEGGPMHVDGAYSTIRAKHPELVTFCYAPSLGFQRPSRTDIGNQRLFDKISILQPLVRMGRHAKARLSELKGS